MSGIGTLAKAGAKEGAELAAKYVPKIQKLLDSGDTAGAAAVAKEARTEIAASSFVIPDKKLKQLNELLNKADPVDKNLFPADLSSVTATPVQNRASGDIGLPRGGGGVKGPVTTLNRENQPLHQDKGVDFSLETAIAPYKKPGDLIETLPEEKALSRIPDMDATDTSTIMRNVTPPKSKIEETASSMKKAFNTPDAEFEEKDVNLKGLAAGTLGTALATQADTPMFGNKQEEEKPVSPLPKMDIPGTKVAEAPTSEVKPPATTTPTSQKTAPANANKREQAAKLGVDEQIDKLNQAKETASSTARENYDRVLSKLETLKTRIDSFDSRERQILAYERLGDMLARAFANLGAGLTAAKQGVAIKPLDLSPGDQSSRYADLQALSKQRYGQLEAERDTAGKVYSEELKAAEQARQNEFDKLRLKQQAEQAELDRKSREKIQALENASRENRAGLQGSKDTFKVAKEIYDSADAQVIALEKQKQEILKQKKPPKTLLDTVKAQYQIDDDEEALSKWAEIQDGLIYQARQKRTEARNVLQGIGVPQSEKVAEAPSSVPTPSTSAEEKVVNGITYKKVPGGWVPK